MSTPPSERHPHEQREQRGRFHLYDEKFVLSGKGTYDSRKPQVWLLSLRNYLAGRNEEMDPVLDWCEAQVDFIPKEARPPAMVDCAEPSEVSRQLWAFLGPLVAGDASMDSIFANVPRHNGFDAWRRIAEPVNDDKAIVLQELLGPVTNPKGATNMASFTDALKLWETNIRLFTAAGGTAPEVGVHQVAPSIRSGPCDPPRREP